MALLDQLLKAERQRRALPPPAVRRAIRERAGLSQGDLARVLRLDRASISRYETGARTPQRSFVARYLAVLDRLAKA